MLVVGDGALHYLPFGILSASDEKENAPSYLVESHEIISLPSASVIDALRGGAANRAPAPLAVAVLADPVFDREDSRLTKGNESHVASPESTTQRTGFDDLRPLPSTRREAQAIQKSVPPRQSLIALGFEASRATVMNLQEGRYRIIHFATHGVFNDRHPELSGVVLSLFDANGKSQDGTLRLHDIYSLKLPSEMVVLSACSTGLGNVVRGEGMIGLTRGFMYAGSPRVLASLWRVDDLATSVLMEKLYQHMLKGGLTPPAALRAAQVEMLRGKRWRSPFYWAGFVLQGDWGKVR